VPLLSEICVPQGAGAWWVVLYPLKNAKVGLEPHRERMKEVFGQVLEAMKDALNARKIFVVKASLLTVGPITMPDWKG